MARQTEPADIEGRLFELQASICQTLSNHWRLRILEVLGPGELSVSEIGETLGMSKANLSQHLGIMRERGVLTVRREGPFAYYRLADGKILEACRLMRRVLLDRLAPAGAWRGTPYMALPTPTPGERWKPWWAGRL